MTPLPPLTCNRCGAGLDAGVCPRCGPTEAEWADAVGARPLWEDLGEFATSPGMSSESFRLFRATGLTRTGAGGGTPQEAITVHVVALAALPDWLAAQRARGRKTSPRV